MRITQLDEERDRNIAVKSLRDAINQHAQEQTTNTQVLKNHTGQIKSISDSIRGISGRLESTVEEQKKIMAPIRNLKSKVESALGEVDFPIKKTIIAQNVWCHEKENLDKIGELLINKSLNLHDVKIVKIVCKTGREGKSGVVKIELESEADVK